MTDKNFTAEITLEEVDENLPETLMRLPENFPFILIEGVTSTQEVTFFQNRCYNPESSLPLYVNVDGSFCEIGKIDLSLDSILSIGGIYDYKLFLYLNKNDAKEIDLRNPNSLIKFIKL